MGGKGLHVCETPYSATWKKQSTASRVTIHLELIFALCCLPCVKRKKYSVYSFSEVYIVFLIIWVFLFVSFFDFASSRRRNDN